MKELEMIHQSGEKELRREHPESFDVKSSLSRCDDLEKRLAGIKSPVGKCLSDIKDQMDDQNLTDGKLRAQLESTSDKLHLGHNNAIEIVGDIQAKMSDLKSAMAALDITAAILQRYGDTITNNSVCTTIDDFEHRQALLTELVNEIPSNDPKFENLK
jgi:hypothetical protein